MKNIYTLLVILFGIAAFTLAVFSATDILNTEINTSDHTHVNTPHATSTATTSSLKDDFGDQDDDEKEKQNPNQNNTETGEVFDFFSCVDKTGIVAESYPRQCFYEGRGYTEIIEQVVETGDSSILEFAIDAERVTCTGVTQQECLVVNGEYFYDEIEGFLFDPGYTYNLFVERTLAFGTDDPSEIPVDASLYAYKLIELVSKKEATINNCVRAGCSSQLCISQEEAASGGVSTCEYREEYACYAGASCEPQESGECGWTETEELTECLINPPSLE